MTPEANRDDLERLVADGRPLTQDQAAALAELHEKARHRVEEQVRSGE